MGSETDLPIENARVEIKNWVTLYADSLYTWALHKTSSKETAEDLVQETFLAAVQFFERYKEKSTPKTWLFSILNNKISDYYRRKYKNPATTELQQSDDAAEELFETLFERDGHWANSEKPLLWSEEPEHLLDNEEFCEILQQCLQKLPVHWRAAIQLKYLEEKNGESICQELAISPTNYWQVLHRAKLQLRKCLERNWFVK